MISGSTVVRILTAFFLVLVLRIDMPLRAGGTLALAIAPQHDRTTPIEAQSKSETD
jgi:hypothetical protein